MSIKEVSCPECDYRLKVRHHLHQGQRMTCPACESKLVVVSLKPVELEAASPVHRLTEAKKKPHAVETLCPECDAFITLSTRSHEGHRVLCNSCNTTLEVVGTNPLELDVALIANYNPHRRHKLEE